MNPMAVTLMRVKRNKLGAIPNGFVEGALVGVTDLELEALKKNPHLLECFEEVTIKQRSPYATEPESKPTSETASATDESSLSTGGAALDGKT